MTTAMEQVKTAPVETGNAGYHQSWYPLVFSSEINDGKVVGKDFLDGRVVIYRSAEGKAVVQSAYCRHLGADLSIGKVVDGNIQCAFHHWQYNTEGRCVKIATGDKPPSGAKLFTYPTAEAWGLVWAFNGDTPLFEVPHVPGYTESTLLYEIIPYPITWEVEPWVLLSNSADIQHLRSFHGLTVYEPENLNITDYSFEYDISFEDPNFGKFNQHLKLFGTNVLCLNGALNGVPVALIAAICPTKGRSLTNFLISSTPLPPGTLSEEQREQLLGLVRMNCAFFQKLAEEDKAIMDTIRFREGLLVETDRFLARYLKYIRHFPKADPARNYQ
jgi:phenylpropionate dioxygenase-like ring-hydroxylating dioxygenase large terminal subunit